MTRGKPRRTAAPIVLAIGVLLAACGGGGGGDPARDETDLVLTTFELVDGRGNPTGATDTTNAYRNNRLRLTFSESVDPASVDERTIAIGIPSGTSLFLTARGRFTVDGNRVEFDPTVTSTGAPHPFGFEPNATYTVLVRGAPGEKTVLTTGGDPAAGTFTTSFRTTDLYLPDLDQPRMETVAPEGLSSNDVAVLRPMTLEERVADNAATGRWERLWVESRGDVVVRFSEAMNPATFDPLSSFRVVNLDRNGRDVLGTFLFSDDATRITFRPTFGYGRGPHLVRVTVTTDLTDLAGNPIANPREWVFLTEYDPTAINEGLVEEPFDDNAHEDTAFLPVGSAGLARWNPPEDPGKLVSSFGNSSVTIPTSSGGSSNHIPLGSGSWNSSRCQMWYKASELGSPGTVSGLHFIAGTTSSPGAVLSNLTVRIGHNSSATGLTTASFAANLDLGTPVTAVGGVTYTLPSSIGAGQPVAFPSFQRTFGFNGIDNVVLDVGKASISVGSQAWDARSGFDGNVRRAWSTSQSASAPSGSSIGYAYRCVVDFRTETSMARSLWYRTESDDPAFLAPILDPVDQPAGTETVIEYQGAHDDGSGAPDPATVTGYTTDLADLDGHRHVRIRFTFTANLGTGEGPKLAEIVLPYVFF